MADLICFGASTAQGSVDSQGGFFARLEKKLAAAGKPRECHNLGIGGNTTRDMLGRVERIKEWMPSPAIIVLGCNDMPRPYDKEPGRRVDVSEYTANLQTLFATFSHPQTIFVSSFLVRPVTPEIFASYMNAALEVARSRGFQIWDLYGESLRADFKYLSPDGIHYADEGHEMMAEWLCGMICKWE